MSIAAIIQARMGSTRLPGKIMKKLAGEPMLTHVIRRVQSCEEIEKVCIATTSLEKDDPVEELAASEGVIVFRGDEEDVLSRFAGAADILQCDTIVRITSDCPFYDASLLTEMIKARAQLIEKSGPIDYYSNCIERSYPRGLDTEIVPTETLYIAHREATSQRDREHVMPFIWSQPERFRLESHFNSEGNWSDLRWTVDTPEDFALASEVYMRLAPENALFDRFQIFELLRQNPELSKINQHVEQKKI